MSKLWINGQFTDERGSFISARDSGFLHGMGVFTTLRVFGGRVVRLNDHLKRLTDSAMELGIPLDWTADNLTQAAYELLDLNHLSEARMRITLTRGAPDDKGKIIPSAVISAIPFEAYPASFYHQGMTVIVLDQWKLNPHDPLAGHKTLNMMPRFMALRKAADHGAGEAIWFNTLHQLQSGSVSNVFVVKDGQLLTPATRVDEVGQENPAPSAVLPGVTRKTVLELCVKNNLIAHPAVITIEDLLSADEVLLTNSIMGVMPVCRIERHVVGEGKPGSVYQKLSELYDEELRKG